VLVTNGQASIQETLLRRHGTGLSKLQGSGSPPSHDEMETDSHLVDSNANPGRTIEPVMAG
jgi:hypothetical protein